MSNEFYLHTTYPTPNSPGSSANLRAELESIEAGFEKMPALSGQGGKVVAVNTGGTALESTSNVAGLAITGGSINNTPIGATTPSTGAFTTATASTGFVGPLTGNVGGNLTGNVTSSGTSSFNNVNISGSLDMNSGTSATVTGLSAPVNGTDAATKSYVDTSISNLLASAPGTLDTLNELATALGNDPNFATTVTNSIATKLALAGGTMSGVLNMGNYKITGLAAPTVGSDAINLTYVTTLYGSTAAAAASATAAAASADTAAANAGAASSNASSAASSASTALSYLNSFRGQYYGPASADPTLDPVGNAPTNGDLYFNTASNLMKAYNGSSWQVTYNPGVSGTVSSVDVSGGTTGLTTSGGPITSSGTITLAGTLAVANGGTGATSAAAALTALGAYAATNPAGYTTNVGTVTGVTGTAPIVSSGGTAPAISISAATTSAAGSMSAADKTKLDGIATGATANTGTVTSVAASVPAFLSVSGSPVTTTGTLAITYSGTALPVLNGGTGATTAGAALTALGAFPIAGGTLTGVENYNATQTIASATTTDIGAATSNQVIISGTTTITGLGTIAAGATRWVTFSGALTLTHNATSLILPGNASIATVAGDSAVFVSLGTGNWRCTAYQRGAGLNATQTGTETLLNKTIQAATFTDGYTEETVTANTTTAYTIDLLNGTVQILTLTGNCVYTFPTATAGKSFLLIQKQDGTGSRTVTWPSVTNPVKWPSSTAPTITSTASKADVFAFTADGTNWYGRVIGQNYL